MTRKYVDRASDAASRAGALRRRLQATETRRPGRRRGERHIFTQRMKNAYARASCRHFAASIHGRSRAAQNAYYLLARVGIPALDTFLLPAPIRHFIFRQMPHSALMPRNTEVDVRRHAHQTIFLIFANAPHRPTVYALAAFEAR